MGRGYSGDLGLSTNSFQDLRGVARFVECWVIEEKLAAGLACHGCGALICVAKPMDRPIKFRLNTFPVHLGLGAKVVLQDEFTGSPRWYQRYAEGSASDGAEGRLVTMHKFTKSWGTWEMHPHGEELVLCIQGTMTVIQEINGKQEKSRLHAGEAIINPAGIWHTADLDDEEGEEATAVFITAGMGTEIRPREA